MRNFLLGLWDEAQSLINGTMTGVKNEVQVDRAALSWNAALINFWADSRRAQIDDSPYPLMSQLFYGDYAAAVAGLRGYSPEQIFTLNSPLIKGTPAEGWIDGLIRTLVEFPRAALRVHPGLAEAYFLKGWGEYLQDPQSQQARADIQQAAALRPEDTFFQTCAAYLKTGN